MSQSVSDERVRRTKSTHGPDDRGPGSLTASEKAKRRSDHEVAVAKSLALKPKIIVQKIGGFGHTEFVPITMMPQVIASKQITKPPVVQT